MALLPCSSWHQDKQLMKCAAVLYGFHRLLLKYGRISVHFRKYPNRYRYKEQYLSCTSQRCSGGSCVKDHELADKTNGRLKANLTFTLFSLSHIICRSPASNAASKYLSTINSSTDSSNTLRSMSRLIVPCYPGLHTRSANSDKHILAVQYRFLP